MDGTHMDMDVQSLAATASRLLATLSQDTRLIDISTPDIAGWLPDALVVERFEGFESVCGDFRFDIDCLATSAFLDHQRSEEHRVGHGCVSEVEYWWCAVP